jgi:hypothetical protein
MDENFPSARIVWNIQRQGAVFTTIKRAARLDGPTKAVAKTQ